MTDTTRRATLLAVPTEFTGTLVLPIPAGTEAYDPWDGIRELAGWLAGTVTRHRRETPVTTPPQPPR